MLYQLDEDTDWIKLQLNIGFKEHILCRIPMWTMTNTNITPPITKCPVNIRFRITVISQNSNWVTMYPNNGKTESIFIITIAAQYDICPKGRIYPKNASNTLIINNIYPLNHR
jgi:hypothetical protein